MPEKTLRYSGAPSADGKQTSRPIHDERIGHLPKRLKLAINGESIRSFAEKAGVSEGTLRNLLGGGIPRLDNILRIADAAGVSGAWLATGEGPMRPEEAIQEGLEEEFALVPLYDVEVSAGHGAHIDQEEVQSQIAFRRDWLSKNGFNIKDLVSLAARGDSMEPTIRDGDLLLVDTSQKDVLEDGIYVLRMNNHLLAKRLQRMFDGTVVIKSDNPAYERQEVKKDAAQQLEVIGRVVWAGRKM